MDIYHHSYAVVKCKFSDKHFFLPRTALIPKLSEGELVHVILCAGQWKKREVEIIFLGDYYAADKVFHMLENQGAKCRSSTSQGAACRPSSSRIPDPNACATATHRPKENLITHTDAEDPNNVCPPATQNTPPREITPMVSEDCLVIKFTPPKEKITWSPVKTTGFDSSYRVIKYTQLPDTSADRVPGTQLPDTSADRVPGTQLPDTSADRVPDAVAEAPLSVWMEHFIQLCNRHKLIVACNSSTVEVTLPADFVECPTWPSPDFYREMVVLIRLFDLELLRSDGLKIIVHKSEETSS